MKPRTFKNLRATSLCLLFAAGPVASAAVIPFVDGITMGSSGQNIMFPWVSGTRNNVNFDNYGGGINFVSSPPETAHGYNDGGFTFYGTPFNILLGNDYGYDGTFNVWDLDSYWNGSGYFPVFKIDTAADTAAFRNVNVSITNGSLTVAGNINLTGVAGSGLTAGGTPLFTMDSAGKVTYAAGRPVAITSTTLSSSSITGALTVSGGIGVAKDSWVNTVRIGMGSGNVGTNTAVGAVALNQNTVGNANSAFGYGALMRNTSAFHNTAIGLGTLEFTTTGSFNTALGSYALTNNTGGSNTALGSGALIRQGAGYGNIAIGYYAAEKQTDGTNLTTASSSIYIGNNSRGSNTDNNTIVVGHGAVGAGANTTVIGTGSTTHTHLKGKTMSASLEVAGVAEFQGQLIVTTPQGDIPMFTGY